MPPARSISGERTQVGAGSPETVVSTPPLTICAGRWWTGVVPEPVAAVVLAAGGGTRFDGPGHKLTATLRGRPVVAWALAAAAEAEIGPLIVVTGAVPLDPDWVPPGTHVVVNDQWSRGQAMSLQCGVTKARELGHKAVVVGLGDQPFIPADAWRAVAASSASIAVATYGGARGNPVRLAADVWP